MPPEIHLTEASPAWTAVVRERVAPADFSAFVPAACGEVWSFVRAPGMPRPGRNVALYGAQGLVEAGVEVAEPFVGNERIHCSQLPAGRVAHLVHMGAYGRLREAHAALRQWCAVHGHECVGVSWELYGHWQESWNTDPSLIRTDVFYLLNSEESDAVD